MTWVSILLAILVSQSPAQDPAAMVRQLGSPQYAEREAAAAVLEAMGLAALPALRAAGDSNDLEIRTRASALVDRIERNERDRPPSFGGEPAALDRPSMVRLDFEARSLDSVLAGFGPRSPSRLAWHPDTPEAVRRRPVTFREPAPLPFWAAIDRLCKAGGLRYIPGSPTGPGGGQPEFRLFLAPGTSDGPRADSGPFRLELVGISHSRHVNFIPNRPGQMPGRGRPPSAFGARREDFRVDLRILAEPRMLMRAVGHALIAEAVDDRGQTLLPGPAPQGAGVAFSHRPPQAALAYSLNLRHPKQAGKVIRRLKLTIPVEVETLKPDRLAIRLAKGKAVKHGRTSIEVLGVGVDTQGHQRVKLKLESDEVMPERLAINPDGTLAPAPNRLAPPEVGPNVIQVLDQHGRQFPWHVESLQENGAEVITELMMWPEGGIPIPVPAGRGVVPGEDRPTAVPSVLFHTEVGRGVIVATFEFHDIPLP